MLPDSNESFPRCGVQKSLQYARRGTLRFIQRQNDAFCPVLSILACAGQNVVGVLAAACFEQIISQCCQWWPWCGSWVGLAGPGFIRPVGRDWRGSWARCPLPPAAAGAALLSSGQNSSCPRSGTACLYHAPELLIGSENPTYVTRCTKCTSSNMSHSEFPGAHFITRNLKG